MRSGSEGQARSVWARQAGQGLIGQVLLGCDTVRQCRHGGVRSSRDWLVVIWSGLAGEAGFGGVRWCEVGCGMSWQVGSGALMCGMLRRGRACLGVAR